MIDTQVDIWDFGYMPCRDLTAQMEHFIQTPDSPEMIWIGEHPPIITTGPRTDHASIFNPSLNRLSVARGGMATLHMPGQLMFYPLISIKKFNLHIRTWIELLEQSIINTLIHFNLMPLRCKGEPGVYLPRGKIASIGVKIKNQKSYFGACINVSCNLDVFKSIIPCGLRNRPVTSMCQSGSSVMMQDMKQQLCQQFTQLLLTRANYPAPIDAVLR